jgi:hypothetical protein
MEKFKELVNLCGSRLSIMMNNHKDCHESVEEYLSKFNTENTPKEVLKKMIELDTTVRIIAYPDMPIGFCEIYHYDIDKAIDSMLDTIKQEHEEANA